MRSEPLDYAFWPQDLLPDHSLQEATILWQSILAMDMDDPDPDLMARSAIDHILSEIPDEPNIQEGAITGTTPVRYVTELSRTLYSHFSHRSGFPETPPASARRTEYDPFRPSPGRDRRLSRNIKPKAQPDTWWQNAPAVVRQMEESEFYGLHCDSKHICLTV